MGFALVNPTGTRTDLHELVNLLDDAITLYDDNDYAQTPQGGEGFETTSEYFNLTYLHLQAGVRLDSVRSTLDGVSPIGLASWAKLGLHLEISVYWLKPKMVKGIEAWITLDGLLSQEWLIGLYWMERDPEV